MLNINNKLYLFIIENKVKLSDNGKNQLFNYFYNLPFDKLKKIHKIILVLGYGFDVNFNYILYKYNMKNLNRIPIETKYKLHHYNKEPKIKFDMKQIHELNQYLYDSGINIPKSQKTLFIASILICLKINKKFISEFNEDTNGYVIADKIINTIQEFYRDHSFTQSFNFIKNSIHNNKLFELFKKLENLLNTYGIDILNSFYSEFCIYDRNNDGKFGIVLTPDDIVDLMVKELDIKENDSICDFCTGTGSFLIKASSYSKNLIGCENNEERYSLAKCNFILNDLDYSRLYNNSCFNQPFDKYDKVIINPPFSCPTQDSVVELNETNWKSFKEEQKFVLYQVQLLKDNGIGACIIPRSNINNNIAQTNNFKKELLNYCQILKIINLNSKVFIPNATVECVIIIFKKCSEKSCSVKIIDYRDDGYKINKKIRIKEKDGNLIEQTIDLNYDDDWNCQKDIDMNINIAQLVNNYNNDYNYTLNKLRISQKLYDNIQFNYYKVKLNTIIKPIKCKTYTFDKCEDGDIPFYVGSQLNIPKGFKNVISIDCDKLGLNQVLCINKTGEGVVGYCHIRTGKFAINGIVGAYEMLQELSIINIVLLNYQLKKILDGHFRHFSLNDLNIIEVNLTNNDIKPDELIKLNHIENKIVKEWDDLKIGDYFDIVKPIKIFKINNTENGNIPLVSSKSTDNGIMKYINDYSYDGECLTVARNGSVGSCFYQTDKIGITTDVIILKPKNSNINLHLWAMMINYILPQKYSYNNKLSMSKLLDEIIYIPIFI